MQVKIRKRQMKICTKRNSQIVGVLEVVGVGAGKTKCSLQQSKNGFQAEMHDKKEKTIVMRSEWF